MKKLLLGSVLTLISASFALAQEGPPKPASELSNLKFFAGTWSCSGDSPEGPFGPAHKTQSTVNIKSDLDGFWYSGTVAEMKTASNKQPAKVVFHLGYDSAAKQYVLVSVDNFGTWATETSPGWEGDTMAWGGDQMMMGEKATAKDTFTRTGSDQFSHKFELTMKGQTTTIVDETCKRAGRAKK